MNSFEKYRLLQESKKSSLYGAGNKYTARVVSDGAKHVVKFFSGGEYLKDADYEASDKDDAHEFAHTEMKYRQKQEEKKKTVQERIDEPQGHLESKDRIADDSKKNGVGPKKQMGNRTPLEIIAKILAGKK